MEKYALVGGCVCAVVLLILTSFCSVVESVNSSDVSDSPLFIVRTKRATNQQQNILSSRYLGKGQGTLLSFPRSDNRTESLIKAIQIIGEMDEKTFEMFAGLCVQQSTQDGSINGNPNEIVQVLRQIRTQPEFIVAMLMSRGNEKLDPTNFNCYTILFGPSICLVFYAIIVFLVTLIYTPILIVLRVLTMANCPTMVVSECPTQFYTFCGTCKVVGMR